MNSQTNAMPESFDSVAVAPAALAVTHPMYWSVRRELWENRSIYIAPLAAAAVFLIGFFVGTFHLPARVDSADQHGALITPYDYAAGLIMATTLIVGVFYCLDALYGERRDRSVLFWKSLPVSDRTTVVSKATIPFVILPLLTLSVTVATQAIMLGVSSAVLFGSGRSVAPLWTELAFGQRALLLLYHLATVHVLWHAPIYGWLLMVSSWARRATFLWAFLPPVAICFVEKIALGTSHFLHLLLQRLTGGTEAITVPDSMPMDPMTHLTPGNFLSSAGLWIGLALTAAFLAMAVRLRRYRGPI